MTVPTDGVTPIPKVAWTSPNADPPNLRLKGDSQVRRLLLFVAPVVMLVACSGVNHELRVQSAGAAAPQPGNQAATAPTTTTVAGSSQPPSQGNQQPALTANQQAQARSLWPTIRNQLLQDFTWQGNPVAKGFMSVPAGSLPPAALQNFGLAGDQPLTIWVVRGVFTDLAWGRPPGAAPPSPPSARGLWVVAQSDGTVDLTVDYPTSGAQPAYTGATPTLREDQNIQ